LPLGWAVFYLCIIESDIFLDKTGCVETVKIIYDIKHYKHDLEIHMIFFFFADEGHSYISIFANFSIQIMFCKCTSAPRSGHKLVYTPNYEFNLFHVDENKSVVMLFVQKMCD